jgi:uncharacterized alkaline shock family protein YloU
MTEVTAGVPAPRTEYDPDQTDVALTAVPAEDSLEHVEPAASYSGDGQLGFRGAVSDAGEKVSAYASDTGEKVSAYASEAGDKVSAYASEAADRAGDYVEKAAGATSRLAGQVAERIRNTSELTSERGSTRIADEVVEKIAGFAAREVEGVYDLGGDVARMFASVKERIGLGDADDQKDRGVTVRLEGVTASVKIVLVIEYGYVVYSVTEKVRTKVIASVENLLGLEVTGVDIVVDDIHIDESKLAATAVKP